MLPVPLVQPSGDSRSPLVAARNSSVHGAATGALTVASLFPDASPHERIVRAVQDFAARTGMSLDLHQIPSALARGGTIGRIGVPHDASAIVHLQRTVIGANFGGDPLAPVPRLWRGLQRRAEVLLDLRQCTTLPGSDAARAGTMRDVLLASQRILDRTVRPSRADAGGEDQWTRAREAADIVQRLALAEHRTVLLVLPVGRGTRAQQAFADAIDRHARLQRLPAPRVIKAGLLAALLCAERNAARWLVASVMPIEELSALATESIGDTGPWPVVSVGRGATFYDMPHLSEADDALPLLLIVVHMLQRSGRVTQARTLLDAMLVTRAAEVRMREEIGSALPVPADAFLRGVLANWGRSREAGDVVVPAHAVPVPELRRGRENEVWSAVRPDARARTRPALSA